MKGGGPEVTAAQCALAIGVRDPYTPIICTTTLRLSI